MESFDLIGIVAGLLYAIVAYCLIDGCVEIRLVDLVKVAIKDSCTYMVCILIRGNMRIVKYWLLVYVCLVCELIEFL